MALQVCDLRGTRKPKREVLQVMEVPTRGGSIKGTRSRNGPLKWEMIRIKGDDSFQ